MTINFEKIDENACLKDHAIAQLMNAIALEEEALSKLISTEADKTFAFVGKNLDFPTDPSTSDIIKFNCTVIQFLDTMLMAEWMLLKKLDQLRYLREVDSLSDDGEKKVVPLQVDHSDGLDY